MRLHATQIGAEAQPAVVTEMLIELGIPEIPHGCHSISGSRGFDLPPSQICIPAIFPVFSALMGQSFWWSEVSVSAS